jgi:G:T-mismatch repair DNA endonuclease (very short patch repair protein)
MNKSFENQSALASLAKAPATHLETATWSSLGLWFWHGCPKCYSRPKTNRAFWDRKHEGNTARDRRALWIATWAE